MRIPTLGIRTFLASCRYRDCARAANPWIIRRISPSYRRYTPWNAIWVGYLRCEGYFRCFAESYLLCKGYMPK